MALEAEKQTYERERDNLLAKAGRFVLVHGNDLVDDFDTYSDALKDGYRRFGVDSPFLVKKIEAIEQVHSFTRDITPCPI